MFTFENEHQNTTFSANFWQDGKKITKEENTLKTKEVIKKW